MGGPTPYGASPGLYSPYEVKDTFLHGDRAQREPWPGSVVCSRDYVPLGAMGTMGQGPEGTKAQRPMAPLLGGSVSPLPVPYV